MDGIQTCPQELQKQTHQEVMVGCDEWKRAKQDKTACNPLTDADCDGIENHLDVTPIQD